MEFDRVLIELIISYLVIANTIVSTAVVCRWTEAFFDAYNDEISNVYTFVVKLDLGK